jgi:hypothetical protein
VPLLSRGTSKAEGRLTPAPNCLRTVFCCVHRVDSTVAGRWNAFDQLRLLGAILVIYGHSYVLFGRPVPTFAANTVSTLGVKIFFCISGYLVAVSWLRDPHLLRFLARRSLRIFPALIVVTLLTTFVLGPALTKMPLSRYFSEVGTYAYLNNIRLYITYFLPGVFEGTSPLANAPSPPVNSGVTLALTQLVTQTITGALTMTGTSSLPVGLIVNTTNIGTVSVGSASTIDYGSILGITKSGAGSITATNSFDMGKNTGITITPPSVGGGVIGG